MPCYECNEKLEQIEKILNSMNIPRTDAEEKTLNIHDRVVICLMMAHQEMVDKQNSN